MAFLLAKLISLTALKTQDGYGEDELVMARGDGGIFERLTMRRNDQIVFDDRLLSFQGQVEIVLTEVDRESQQRLSGLGIHQGRRAQPRRTHATVPRRRVAL